MGTSDIELPSVTGTCARCAASVPVELTAVRSGLTWGLGTATCEARVVARYTHDCPGPAPK